MSPPVNAFVTDDHPVVSPTTTTTTVVVGSNNKPSPVIPIDHKSLLQQLPTTEQVIQYRKANTFMSTTPTSSSSNPIRISSLNQNLIKYSLSNLAEKMNDRRGGGGGGGSGIDGEFSPMINCHMSTLSLDEQYLIDEIQATATRAIHRGVVVSNTANTTSNTGSTGFLSKIAQEDVQEVVKSTSSDEVDYTSPATTTGSSPKSTHSSASLSYSISPSPSSNLSSNRHTSSISGGPSDGDKDSSMLPTGGLEIFGNSNILLIGGSISDDEDVDDEELFGRPHSPSGRLDEENRRETLIFKQDVGLVDKELDSLSMRNHDDEDDIDLNITPSEEDINNYAHDDASATTTSHQSAINTTSSSPSVSKTSGSRHVISKPSAASDTLSSNNSSSLACEVASLTSVYSNYSQYDFLQQNNSMTTTAASPPTTTTHLSSLRLAPVSSVKSAADPSPSIPPSHSSSFSSFLGIFSKRPSLQVTNKSAEKSSTTTLTSSSSSSTTAASSSSNKTLDLIASKFFNIKTTNNSSTSAATSSNVKSLTESIVTPKPAVVGSGNGSESCQSKTQTISLYKQASMYSTPSWSSSTSLSESSNNKQPTTNAEQSPAATSAIKPTFSSNNLIGDPDFQVPSSVLIFENRPSNLPAKSQQEELKHRQEYEKMIEAAKRKEQKEKELKIKKYQQQIRKEDFMAQSLRLWNTEILTNWNEQKSTRRTQQLWWHGIPPSVRGKVWKLAIGNELNLTEESYMFHWKKAKQKLKYLNRETTTKANEEKNHSNDSSVELIQLDVSRTFPHLCFFQKDGPYHEALHNVLGAYACYNTSMGYVQGMSFLTAILLLNMDPPDAFICLANLLNTKYLLACFCMDQTKMNRFFRVHQILFEYNLPKLYRHFAEQKVKPDLYLIEWIFTLFSKSLPLDVMSRVWDVFFRDKEEFLFKTALGILRMYKDRLLDMDFIHIVQFLTKLPEDINASQLFKSIDSININIDDTYLTFDNLINEIVDGNTSSSSSSTTPHIHTTASADT